MEIIGLYTVFVAAHVSSSLHNVAISTSVRYQGVAFGPWISRHCPSFFTRCWLCLASLTPISPTLTFLNPHLPIAHIRPTPILVASVGGARTKAAPETIPPNAVAPIAATIDPTKAYFAYLTIRQKINTPIYRTDRRRARVRSRAGRGELGESGARRN